MSKTRLDLINQSLTNLGVIAEGQAVSGQDIDKMDTIVDGALAELGALDIYYVQDAGSLGPSGGTIDDGAFLSLADYVANRAAASFNMPASQQMEALSMAAQKMLTTLAAPPRGANRLKIDRGLPLRRYIYYNGGF